MMPKGFKHSEETKRKISISSKGRISANRGKHLSEETKRKMREKRKYLIFSPETCKKMSNSKLGSKNPMWKGDKVGYFSLHEWIRGKKIKPVLCECCKKESPHDIANISGEYKRDLDDWEYLCRRCHMTKDGRLLKLKNYAKRKNNKS